MPIRGIGRLALILLLALVAPFGTCAAAPAALPQSTRSGTAVQLPFTLDELIDRLLKADPPVPQTLRHIEAVFGHPFTRSRPDKPGWRYLGPLVTRDGVHIAEVQARPSGLGDHPDRIVMLLISIAPTPTCVSLAALRKRYGLETLRLTSDVPPQTASGGWYRQFRWGNLGAGFSRFGDRCTDGVSFMITRWPASSAPPTS